MRLTCLIDIGRPGDTRVKVETYILDDPSPALDVVTWTIRAHEYDLLITDKLVASETDLGRVVEAAPTC